MSTSQHEDGGATPIDVDHPYADSEGHGLDDGEGSGGDVAYSHPHDGEDAHSEREYGQELWERPLSVRGRKLREEAIDVDGTPKSVGETVDAFRSYIREKQDQKLVFENGVESMSHRFSDRYARQKYGETAGADRVLQEQFDDLHCALITLRGYPWNADGDGRAPADHLDDLLASNRSVIDALRYSLGQKRDRRFARQSILEPHRHGYGHIHHGIWVEGEIDESAFQNAVDAHVRECPIAREEAHEDGAVVVWESSAGKGITGAGGGHDPRASTDDTAGGDGRDSDHAPGGDVDARDGDTVRDPLTTLALHQTKGLVGWNGILDAEAHVQRFASVLWATGRDQLRRDSTFRDAIERSQADFDSGEGESGGGDFIGVELADGTRVSGQALGSENSGGSTMAESTGLPDGVDPLPEW